MENDFKDLLSFFFEGIYIVDINRKIIFWNSGSERITGYKAEEVMNEHCFNNILRHVTQDGTALCFGGCPLHHTIQTGEINEADVFLHHKDGHRVPVTVKSLPLRDDKDVIIGAIEVFTDNRVFEGIVKENRDLKELISMDSLTQIPNRRYLDFYLENLVKEVEQFDIKFGILFFDIDDFKHVNDTYGHNIGDEILKMVSMTLKSNVRGVDVIGRWGGEEFIAILKLNSTDELQIISEKLRNLVQNSFYEKNNININVTISIGGTMFQEDEDVNETIHRADQLMYQSKQNGKNQSTIK